MTINAMMQATVNAPRRSSDRDSHHVSRLHDLANAAIAASRILAPGGERGSLIKARQWVPQEDVAAGGLASYGASNRDAFRLVGEYAGRILSGKKPANLPVQQLTKLEMAIDLKTAKALGLSIPLPLLGRADEVIE
jgi:hypothetical protein